MKLQSLLLFSTIFGVSLQGTPIATSNLYISVGCQNLAIQLGNVSSPCGSANTCNNKGVCSACPAAAAQNGSTPPVIATQTPLCIIQTPSTDTAFPTAKVTLDYCLNTNLNPLLLAAGSWTASGVTGANYDVWTQNLASQTNCATQLQASIIGGTSPSAGTCQAFQNLISQYYWAAQLGNTPSTGSATAINQSAVWAIQAYGFAVQVAQKPTTAQTILYTNYVVFQQIGTSCANLSISGLFAGLMITATNAAGSTSTAAIYAIALDGQDNWWSAVDPASDGFFWFTLTGPISSATTAQTIGVQIGGVQGVVSQMTSLGAAQTANSATQQPVNWSCQKISTNGTPSGQILSVAVTGTQAGKWCNFVVNTSLQTPFVAANDQIYQSSIFNPTTAQASIPTASGQLAASVCAGAIAVTSSSTVTASSTITTAKSASYMILSFMMIALTMIAL